MEKLIITKLGVNGPHILKLDGYKITLGIGDEVEYDLLPRNPIITFTKTEQHTGFKSTVAIDCAIYVKAQDESTNVKEKIINEIKLFCD